MKDRDEQERTKIEIRLHLPPVGTVPTTGRWSPQSEMASFSALKQALGQ